jgi:dipeptidyl aminopeptidase/acylaminoacyl peptidase
VDLLAAVGKTIRQCGQREARVQDQHRSRHDWSADGSLLLHGDIDPKIRRQDISVLLMRGARGEPPKATTFVHTAFDENMARFSPDGRWVAYQSDESGRYEIYVRPIGSDGAAGAGK